MGYQPSLWNQNLKLHPWCYGMTVQVQHQLSDGNRIPVLGLGTWPLVGETCQSVVQRALALGYIHIDTAERYGNQRAIGKALKNFDRSQIFITSKVWGADLHYEDVLRACRRTLEELDTDYLNLYLIHWPNKDIPIKETLSALKALVEGSQSSQCWSEQLRDSTPKRSPARHQNSHNSQSNQVSPLPSTQTLNGLLPKTSDHDNCLLSTWTRAPPPRPHNSRSCQQIPSIACTNMLTMGCTKRVSDHTSSEFRRPFD